MEKISILSTQERMKLPMVLQRRTKFQHMVETSIRNYKNIFSNSLLISGKAGTGKTTLVLQELENLKAKGVIADYTRASGHVTPSSMYQLLKKTARPDCEGKPNILILDDVDCISQSTDIGCYELLKSALDTKSDLPTNRQVYYMTDAGSGFRYNGFCIIITNNPFNPDRITPHQEALLDRVQMVNVDLRIDDMFIYNAYLVENYLNENPDHLTDGEIKQSVDLFNNEIRVWNEKEAFKKAKISFSIRLMKKFIDASRMFRDDWKQFNMQYLRLKAAEDMMDVFEENKKTVDLINPKTGKPYSSAYINMLKRTGKLDEKIAKLA